MSTIKEQNNEILGFKFKSECAIKIAKKLVFPIKFEVIKLVDRNVFNTFDFTKDSEVYKSLMENGKGLFNMLCDTVYKPENSNNFVYELGDLLNKYSKENESNTQDFVLAKYLCDCLAAFNIAKNKSNELIGPVINA